MVATLLEHQRGQFSHLGQRAFDGCPAVPGLPADHLPGVQATGLLAELVIFLDSARSPATTTSARRLFRSK
jgi:hypothetical protein